MSKYRTKADGVNSSKSWRPQLGIYNQSKLDEFSLKITADNIESLRRLAADAEVGGTLTLKVNKYKNKDTHPTHIMTLFTAEERTRAVENYAKNNPKEEDDTSLF